MQDKTEFHWDTIVEPLLAWYQVNARTLPWREQATPYSVWISEIMLQQTRVDAVIPYYNRFLTQLPDVKALAECEEEKYLKLWEGLGYYSRVRNLHKAAVEIMEKHQGTIPSDSKELRALSGIGSYTAGAIASIAYGKREPAVDGNVLRILSRLSQDPSDILEPKTKLKAETTLREMMVHYPKEEFLPGAFNQALMDLGATICIPNGKPLCASCPLSSLCLAHRNGKEEALPVRIRKTKRSVEDRTILLLKHQNCYFIRKRPLTGLLAGLYELPNVLGEFSEEEAQEKAYSWGFLTEKALPIGKAKHLFSHIEWRMTGYAMEVETILEGREETKDFLLVTKEDLENLYALPSAFSYYLKKL